MIWQLRQEQAKTCYVLFVTVNLFKKHCHGFKGVSSILEHTASDGNFSRGNPIKSRIKIIFFIRATTSAERYCNEEPNIKS